MFYYLAPIALLIGVLVLALFYWGDRDDSRDDLVEPTTGISEETTPGGGNPDPKPGDTRDENEFRGGDSQR
jgi:cbb3-type cytochrome oxidase maturation protein